MVIDTTTTGRTIELADHPDHLIFYISPGAVPLGRRLVDILNESGLESTNRGALIVFGLHGLIHLVLLPDSDPDAVVESKLVDITNESSIIEQHINDQQISIPIDNVRGLFDTTGICYHRFARSAYRRMLVPDTSQTLLQTGPVEMGASAPRTYALLHLRLLSTELPRSQAPVIISAIPGWTIVEHSDHAAACGDGSVPSADGGSQPSLDRTSSRRYITDQHGEKAGGAVESYLSLLIHPTSEVQSKHADSQQIAHDKCCIEPDIEEMLEYTEISDQVYMGEPIHEQASTSCKSQSLKQVDKHFEEYDIKAIPMEITPVYSESDTLSKIDGFLVTNGKTRPRITLKHSLSNQDKQRGKEALSHYLRAHAKPGVYLWRVTD